MKSENCLIFVACQIVLSSLLYAGFSGDFSQSGGAVYDSNYKDIAYGVAVDTISGGSPYVYVVGQSSGSGTADWFVVKYGPDGLMVSSATYDSGYEDIAYDVAIDGNGNVFVTGFKGNGSNRDYLTMKYDSNLVMISSATYDEGSGDDESHGIAIDGSGNVFVAGFSYSAAGDSTYDYYTIKYDNNLNAITNVYYNSNNSDYAYDVAVGTLGKVFVTGAVFNGADYDFFTVKYANDLSLLEASKSYDGGDVDNARSIVVDRISGKVFVTGESNQGTYDYFTIKYDNGLVALSSAAYNGGSSDYAKGIVIDNTGNVIVTGQSSSQYFTIKYSNNLIVYSSASYSGGTYDTGYAVAVGTSNYIYVTGAISS